MEQIQVPQGMRDLITDDFRKKEALRKRIENIFASWGYEPVSTPALEYYQTFDNAYNELTDDEMYKFVDRNGHVLALRSDMTVPIARMTASRFALRKPPFRFRYCEDVYKVRHSFAGQRNEATDCGIECIGLGEESNLEVLSIALDTMAAIGAGPWQLELGNSSFFRSACTAEKLDKEDIDKLARLIDRKSMVDLSEFVASLSLSEKAASFFCTLPLLGGDASIFEKAEEISFTDDLKAAVAKMKTLYEKLKVLGYGSQVYFDFGKAPHLDYYTGIIFEGYVEGVGTSFLSGGRYDCLLAKFGKDMPACGFSIKLDTILDALPKEKEIPVREVTYRSGEELDALLKARELRKLGPVRLKEEKEETL